MTVDFNLRQHTILLTVSGSRAYGIQLPDSDVDLKGVAIPPRRYFFGFTSVFHQTDDAAAMQSFVDLLTPAEVDSHGGRQPEGTVYNLIKFARLAAECNPNILDVLFCRPQEIRFTTVLGNRLREHAGWFLSAKARYTFGGYAAAQLKRIKGHRRWLLDPPKKKPSRSDYDLPQRSLIPTDQLAAAQAAIEKKMNEWAVDYGTLDRSEILHIQTQVTRFLAEIMETTDARWRCASRAIGYDENFMVLLDRERRYRGAMRGWQQYQNWKTNRNATRAVMEAKFGYDVKHAAHLVRLLRMGREILSSGKVRVWRGEIDAEELKAIRRGAWSYDELLEKVAGEERALEKAFVSKDDVVPRVPDRQRLNRLVIELVAESLKAGDSR